VDSSAHILDGTVAKIQLGTRHLQAVWRQDQGSWVTTELASEETPPVPVQFLLLYVDHPIARLLGTAHQSAGVGVDGTVHRTSLLLKVKQPAPTVLFVGSDHTSEPPEQPADGTQVSVQCVARGCWGTCLPVVVAGLEEEEEAGGGEEGKDKSASLIALTVSMFLYPART
jgi:hypothetical protein